MNPESTFNPWIEGIVLGLILGFFLLLGVTGCASREPSSTDNHHRLPTVDCSELK